MKITRFQFTNKALEWSLSDTTFDRLTLLVGASGVGKTQILNAIQSLQRIANGKSISGIKWMVEFETITGQNYIWEGEYENKGMQFIFDDDDSKRNKPKILREKLSLNGKEIIKRNSKETFFQAKKTLKLSPEQSTINILKEEDLIQPAYKGFKKIIYSDYSESQRSPINRFIFFNTEKLLKKFSSLKRIQESDEEVTIKLYLVSKIDKSTFDKIKERFCEIFPQVEDIKIDILDVEDEGLPSFFKDSPFIQIKEKGIGKWIQQGKISSGMFRTLIHVSEIYLCPEGTIFLIDEFENSLGINCIDELTNDILKSSRQIQFIITSHHPYIINNIHYSNWKLVTRKLGIVKTHPVEKFNIGKSKHDAFMQLMQLEEYQTGQE
jgi:predicted ATPase